MFERIKCKLIFFIRRVCGYYELDILYKSLINTNYKNNEKIEELKNKLNTEIIQHEELKFKYNTNIIKLESKLEAKILEQDINEAKLESKILEYDILNGYFKELLKDKYIFLIGELEHTLSEMNNKGIHPKDLINRKINEAKRQLNKIDR